MPPGLLDGCPLVLVSLGDGRVTAQFVAEDQVKRLCQLGAHVVLVVNEELSKKCKVELAPHGR
ncbi:MAG TPA: hypothetical protein VK655_08170 [Solirubrobacteraceae bacterium]|nr:hypothetical protein [Solirubrobacteraceae bacterium]